MIRMIKRNSLDKKGIDIVTEPLITDFFILTRALSFFLSEPYTPFIEFQVYKGFAKGRRDKKKFVLFVFSFLFSCSSLFLSWWCS